MKEVFWRSCQCPRTFIFAVLGVWQSVLSEPLQQGNAEKRKRKLTAMLEEQKKPKSELRAKLKGEVEQADYEQGNAELTREIAGLERGLREVDFAQATTDAFLRFAGLQLLDVQDAWQMATPEQCCVFEIYCSRTV